MKILLDINEFFEFDKLIETELFFNDIVCINEGATKAASKLVKKRLEKIKFRRGKLAERIKKVYTKKIDKYKKLGKKEEADAVRNTMNKKIERMHDSADAAELATRKQKNSIKDKVDDRSKFNNNRELKKRNRE